MADLKNPKVIWFKGWLFLGLGILAGVMLVARDPRPASILLLCITIWAFARFYYFAFYVIEHYVDPNYKFAGLIDFVQYALSRRDERSERDQ